MSMSPASSASAPSRPSPSASAPSWSCTPHGNVLWDCISLIDEATVEIIKGLGGLAAIAISHPHFYTSMNRWSAAFGGVPVYVHEDDRDWIRRPDPCIRPWSGETLKLLPDVTLIRCGGHFPGAAVLHWSKGADGAGIVCSGDTLTVTADRKFLTFMRSYPNLIPLPPKAIRKISEAMQPFAFERIYGHYFDRVIASGAKGRLHPLHRPLSRRDHGLASLVVIPANAGRGATCGVTSRRL